jgi:hypothetical protein
MNLSRWIRTLAAVIAFALTGGAAVGQTAPTDAAAAMSFLATLPADQHLAVMGRRRSARAVSRSTGRSASIARRS